MKVKRISSDVLQADCGCWMDKSENIHYCVKHKPMLVELSEIVRSFSSGYSGSNVYALVVEIIPPERQRGDPFG